LALTRETLIERTIGACIAVHKELGPGLLESAYSEALSVEFEFSGIASERERSVPVKYRDRVVAHHRVDLVVEGQLVLEIKSCDCFAPVHVAQVINYLKLLSLRAGLLINFNVPTLKYGIRRVVI
jgi:GxxExxY protein